MGQNRLFWGPKWIFFWAKQVFNCYWTCFFSLNLNFKKIDIRFSSIRLTERKKKLYCLPNRTDLEIEKSYCLPTTSSRCWVGGGSTVGGQIFHP
jgi:hypothetical protein